MFIFVPLNHGAQAFREVRPCQHPTMYKELAVTVAVVLLAVAVVTVVALMAAAGAATLVRLDGGTWPSALTRAALTFTAVITLATAVTAALTPLLT
ncbi:hypothetical protein ABZ313_19890 [Streptomyces sp. NPDC006251]|uniref:hypothetical protein n=1 Tax=Streptomyces sp. NPDC006251 TaxID=3155718 RepID=UPI0033A95312